MSTFESSFGTLVEREIERLVDEIAWIDARLLELGENDEDLVEKKLLKILRRHLMKDLYELAGFVWEEPSIEESETAIHSTVLEHAKIESIF